MGRGGRAGLRPRGGGTWTLAEQPPSGVQVGHGHVGCRARHQNQQLSLPTSDQQREHGGLGGRD